MRKLVLFLAGLVFVVVACGGDAEITPEETDSTVLVETSASATPEEAPVDPEPGTPDDGGAAPEEPGTPEGISGETTPTTEPQPDPELTSEDAVTLRALGPVRIGMTVEEASAEAGLSLTRDFGRSSTDSCHYVTARSDLRGVSFMVVDDLIARIEIDSPSTVATRSGVRIGTTAANLQEVYPDNIHQANDAVAEGEAMAFVPNDEADANFRIYFEIEDGAVARFRVGTKPAVDLVAGCEE